MPPLPSIERAWYSFRLSDELRTRDGDAFQSLFQAIMHRRFPDGDFATVGPWGNSGDLKNDGYRHSSRQIFQCYAPRQMRLQALIEKISVDFPGALAAWDGHFDEWVLVHNKAACPAPALQRLMEFQQQVISKRLRAWGEPELKALVLELERAEIADVLGPPLTETMVSEMAFTDITAIIRTIAGQRAAEVPVRPVPAGKIEANHLSAEVEQLLKIGMHKAHLVEQYFRVDPDVTLGDRVAARLREEYLAVRATGATGDDIFHALNQFAGGIAATPPQRMAAVFAVLAYFFERCDIFEEPPQIDVRHQSVSG